MINGQFNPQQLSHFSPTQVTPLSLLLVSKVPHSKAGTAEHVGAPPVAGRDDREPPVAGRDDREPPVAGGVSQFTPEYLSWHTQDPEPASQVPCGPHSF